MPCFKQRRQRLLAVVKEAAQARAWNLETLRLLEAELCGTLREEEAACDAYLTGLHQRFNTGTLTVGELRALEQLSRPVVIPARHVSPAYLPPEVAREKAAALRLRDQLKACLVCPPVKSLAGVG